jgi:hypothetical protein
VTTELKPAWIVGFVIAGLVLVLLFMRTSEELRPELVTAHVAVQPETASVARVGPVETAIGTPFRLFAVVEATDWQGRRIFYTDAAVLEVDGSVVPEDRVRTWNRREKVRVLWFTVEGAPPYSEVTDFETLDRSRYRAVFQADWPQAWTVPGHIAPMVENFLPGDQDRAEPVRFGIQRFHVRIEVFATDSDLLPSQRLRSSGVADLESAPESFPALTATLNWPLDSVSRVFGLPQIEAADGSPEEIVDALADRTRRGLVFSRVPLLRSWLAGLGTGWEDLGWRSIELTGEAQWRPGGVVRAGSKVALTYLDRGVEGRLDRSDLCLDFDRGATVRTLGEVFVGEGLVEFAAVEARQQ